jgi:hypothetical protein
MTRTATGAANASAAKQTTTAFTFLIVRENHSHRVAHAAVCHLYFNLLRPQRTWIIFQWDKWLASLQGSVGFDFDASYWDDSRFLFQLNGFFLVSRCFTRAFDFAAGQGGVLGQAPIHQAE